MIGAKRWDTREGASMWVPSYYPGSCVSQSSALLLITAVFTSSGIIFIIFTWLLTQGHVQGPGECDMWHVIMWWHLSCSVSATHHWWPVWWGLSPGTDLWPVSHDISMALASTILSCGNNAMTQTKLKLFSWCQMSWAFCQPHDCILLQCQSSWADHGWPFLARILTQGGIFIKWQVTMYWSPCLHKAWERTLILVISPTHRCINLQYAWYSHGIITGDANLYKVCGLECGIVANLMSIKMCK